MSEKTFIGKGKVYISPTTEQIEFVDPSDERNDGCYISDGKGGWKRLGTVLSVEVKLGKEDDVD